MLAAKNQAHSPQGTSRGETTDQNSDKEAKKAFARLKWDSIVVRPTQIIFHRQLKQTQEMPA